MSDATDPIESKTGKADGRGQHTGWRRRPGWRVVAGLVALVAISLSIHYIATKLSASVREVGRLELVVQPVPFALSCAAIFVCVFSGGLVWFLVLRGLGARPRLAQCTQVHLLANLGGYLPGYGWRFVGKAYLTHRLGIPLSVASAGVLIEFSVLALTRIGVAVTSMPADWLAQRDLSALVPYLVPTRVVTWLLLVLFPLILERAVVLLRVRNSQRWGQIRVHRTQIWLALGAMSLLWVVFGLGQGALFHAINPLDPTQVGLSIFATTASSLVSLLLFVVPGGLAIRESVVIFVLEGFLPQLVVTAGALMGRAVWLSAELLGALVAWLIGRRRGLCR